MSEYEIKRWDVIISNNVKVPIIYIEPDLAFLEFLKGVNSAVICKIENTGTVYDNKSIPGVADKSCYVPNCHSNFYDKTGLYVITLWADWHGYPEPDKLGTAKFFGIYNSSDEPGEKNEEKQTIEDNSSFMKKLSLLKIIVIISLFLLLLFILTR